MIGESKFDKPIDRFEQGFRYKYLVHDANKGGVVVELKVEIWDTGNGSARFKVSDGFDGPKLFSGEAATVDQAVGMMMDEFVERGYTVVLPGPQSEQWDKKPIGGEDPHTFRIRK